jgi:transcriptional regulator with XRE-family HTH domain
LQKCRLDRNLTQEQVAEQVGICTSFYANIERGKRSMSILTLKEIAASLDVSIDYLLSEDNERDCLQNIDTVLHNMPIQFINSMEKLIRFCTEEFCKKGVEPEQ